MSAASRWRTYPTLGRVSNLPTIATQTAAAIAIARDDADANDALTIGGGLAAAYVAGMFLNDAFDRRVDATDRPGRPIPAGHVGAVEVFFVGGALLTLGAILLVLAGLRRGHAAPALAAATALATAIVVYDAHHKKNPFAPVIMGLCRGLVYVCAAAALAGTVPHLSLLAAVVMGTYVAGLSELARADGRPAHAAPALIAGPLALAVGVASESAAAGALALMLLGVGAQALRLAGRGERERATVVLLAGMSLVDAALLAAVGHLALALAAAAALPVTRALQRLVRGT